MKELKGKKQILHFVQDDNSMKEEGGEVACISAPAGLD